MKIIFLLLITMASAQAYANTIEKCLEQATNNQLLRELKLRLDGSGSGSSVYAFPTLSCFGSPHTINLSNQNGDESSVTMSTSSFSSCEVYSQQMADKLGSKISEPQVVAVCFGSNLERQLLSPDGSIKELNDISLSSSAQCHEKATEINQN